MNQILICDNDDNSSKVHKKIPIKILNTFFKFQFALCSFFAIGFLVFYMYTLYDNNKQEKISR